MESLDMGFEPQTRARSNTWPLPRPEEFTEEGVKCPPEMVDPAKCPALQQPLKKNSSRRNAWGNLSYADLITQAIGSSPNKRLTLSQIYEWMVHNVAYFKDKGDSNSSAGWKNSIRHNLSLHNRFMRVQNEGTGKSSWWVLNPDAKPGKSARRRATSMETSKFEKRRGRVKKKVEALRSGLDATPSPSSSISESLDIFPESPLHGFQLRSQEVSPMAGFFHHIIQAENGVQAPKHVLPEQEAGDDGNCPDFRPRASSNASSCGGRLSPIPSGAEGEWVGGGGGAVPAGGGGQTPVVQPAGYYGPEQLAGSLEQTMRLGQEAVAPPGFAYPIPPPPYRPAPAYTAPHPCPLNHRHMQPCPCTPTNPLNIKREYQTSESPSPPATTMMGQLMGALNPAMLDELNELNINIDTLPLSGGFDCNVDEVIRHELSLDGSLDFNFTQQQAPQPGQEQHPFSGHSWVH